MLFEEISLHYWGISPVNIENRKYLCWQGQHCRAGKKSKHWICRKNQTDSAAESVRHGHPFSPAALQASGPAAHHPLQLAPPLRPGGSTPLPPGPTKKVRWRHQPLPNISQGQQDPHIPASMVVFGRSQPSQSPSPAISTGRAARVWGCHGAVPLSCFGPFARPDWCWSEYFWQWLGKFLCSWVEPAKFGWHKAGLFKMFCAPIGKQPNATLLRKVLPLSFFNESELGIQ